MRSALLALLVLCAACASEEKTVLEPVARLAGMTSPRPDKSAQRCGAGVEIRPSLGCPTSRQIFWKEFPAPETGTVEIPVRIAPVFRRERLLLVATIRHDKEVRTTAQLVEPGTAKVLIQTPNPSKKAGKNLRLGVAAFSLPAAEQTFLTEPVRIPEDGVLTVGIANSSPPDSIVPSPARFELVATAGEERWPLLTETLAPREAASGWTDRRIDLSALTGREVRFEFINSASGQEAGPTFPLWGSPEILAPRARRDARNLLVISLDTVRADHVGGHAAGVALTPRLDELAAQGTTFREAIAPFNSTTASHMSLFTGVYPVLHEVTHPLSHLSDSITPLAETLARNGFQTSAVTENGMISFFSGFDRGFDFYRENRDVVSLASAVEQTVQQGIDWLVGHRDERFFLFLHTYAAHSPYSPPKEFLDLFTGMPIEERPPKARYVSKVRRDYAAEVRYTDATFARLFAEMERLGVLSDTLIVVTSDHGEELGEHGQIGHAKTLYDEVMRVPLIFWGPGLVPAGHQVEAQVSLVDVLPTILELLAIDSPQGLHGVSLVAAMHGRPEGLDAVRFSEGPFGNKFGVELISARTRDYKWVLRTDEAKPFAVFDLRTDPEERKPLQDEALLAEGARLIEGYRTLRGSSAGKKAGSRPVDEETQRKLEALGYVE